MEIESNRPQKRKRLHGDSKDKRIKIKLTTSSTNGLSTPVQAAALSGSEDEDEPEPTIEEHLILRMPQDEMCERLREYVRKREIPEDVKMQFKDSRRGHFYIDGKRYNVTLMDLPTIIESQKTLDKKQFFKVADISQMLLVEPETAPDDLNRPTTAAEKSSDPYSYPHGLGPPLKHVRKRRFRKKLSKRAIEEVEREVERLLEVDATAEDVQYETLDTRDLEMENESDVGTQDIEIDMSDAGESESDEDLAAAIERDLEQMAGARDEDDEDENEEEEEESEEEEEEEGGETGEIEQKRQEIAEIKQAIQRKTHDLLTAPNAILKKRFETYIENLKKELTLKEAHLAEMSKAAASSSNSS
ncbi:hypothetical protein VTP01DRAFT_9529 [Rhizomucor pusillus]|uniref:uncharacterized protein n=1 Tax=Rhizomucor pusillus TaxID=4840 RepID=UPI0037429DF8